MINLSTDRGSAVEMSKQSLLSKRTRGKVRLPPLSRRQLTRYIPQPKQIMHTEYERNASLPFSPNLTSPHITETLHTPADHKCPRSPSNLSLQFNFEEPAAGNGQFVQSIDRVKAVNKNGQKPVKTSMSKTPRVNKGKPKGYHVLNNEEVAVVEKQTEYRKNRGNTITGTSTVKQKSKSHDHWTGTTLHSQSPEKNPSSKTRLRLATADNRERKRSTYDLREFLSLPADNQQKINSMSGPHNKPKRLQHGENPVKLPPYCPEPTSSDDRTYDVFEFLQLSAESSRQLSGVGHKKLKQIRPQIAPKGNSIESTKKPEIPSVIVADWSLNSDAPRTKKAIRLTCELPKANFPCEDFPKTPEHHHTPETEKTHRQRCSVYDLKEFLTLPDVARLHSVRKTKQQDTKPRSNSLEEDSTRETDVKYDLAEFLNFLESGGSGSQSNSTSRERTKGDLTDLGLRNRSLSVYNVYEFLKVTSAKELSGKGRTDNASQGQGKRSIDVTKLVANSSSATKGRQLQDLFSPVSNNEKASHGSCYDLQEFLTLPVTIEDNQNESPTNRGTAERLKIT